MRETNRQAAKGPSAATGFQEALWRLVRVPKSEVDAEEAKYKAMRKRLRDKKAKGKKRGD